MGGIGLEPTTFAMSGTTRLGVRRAGPRSSTVFPAFWHYGIMLSENKTT
ncbi:MAG: hypothetical protein GQ562_11180 [Anaerolineales bacterium]|nr:hypothetical protein [Anaerolineales bacterium]